MTHSASEIKANSSRTVSRDGRPRDISGEPVLDESKFTKTEKRLVVDRRQMFKSLLPASGKALTGFLRQTGLAISALAEEVKRK